MPTARSGETTAAPMHFFCEHGPQSSRIMVMLHRPGMSPAAQTVIDELDATTAEKVARLLDQAAEHGLTPGIQAEFEQASINLSTAHAAPLRQAAEWANRRSWPVPDYALHSYATEDLEDEYDADDEEADDDARAGTPRLADLTGPVVRVERIVDVHIVDQQAFLAAMRAGHWEPDLEASDDPVDLLGAVMSAAEDGGPWEGARLVAEQTNAELLDPASGDELILWS